MHPGSFVLYKLVNTHPPKKHCADYFAPVIKTNIFHAFSLEFHAVFLQFGTVSHADRQDAMVYSFASFSIMDTIFHDCRRYSYIEC